MDNLIDIHTFIWFIEGDKKLTKTAKEFISKKVASTFISIASLWEIAVKISLGKLELKTSFSKISQLIFNNGFQILPIVFEDTLILSELPFHHRDPFDRIIIAQSITNKLSIISRDKIFSEYNISLIW